LKRIKSIFEKTLRAGKSGKDAKDVADDGFLKMPSGSTGQERENRIPE
jgi:hypothetical protein